jgi:predicted nucleic acid-binding protein
MNCVIDASVFVASAQAKEIHSAESFSFIQALQAQNALVFCPTLVITECAAAISRSSRNPENANELVSLITEFPNLQLMEVSFQLAEQAAQIAIQHRLRGADAIYVALAFELGATLVTWDNEMLQRGGNVVKAVTPTDWIPQSTHQ